MGRAVAAAPEPQAPPPALRSETPPNPLLRLFDGAFH